MKAPSRLLAAGVGFYWLAACATTDHAAIVKPPRVDQPVSASPFYLDRSGNTVEPKDYKILQHVQFAKEAKGNVAGVSKSEIDINEDLGRLFEQYDADALVNFQVHAEDYNPGNTFATGFFRIFGGMTLGIGLPILLWGAAESDTEFLVPFGGSFSFIGLVSLGLSFLLPTMSQSVWTIGFEGDLTKRK